MVKAENAGRNQDKPDPREKAEQKPRKDPARSSSAPGGPGGVSSGLQPGGVTPGGGPGAGQGSVGTGGGSTAKRPSGDVKSGGR